jgi:hypothetical protein
MLMVYRFTVQPQETLSTTDLSSDIHVVVEFTNDPPVVGRLSATIDFLFEKIIPKKRFLITRSVNVIINDSADHEAVASPAPVQPSQSE